MAEKWGNSEGRLWNSTEGRRFESHIAYHEGCSMLRGDAGATTWLASGCVLKVEQEASCPYLGPSCSFIFLISSSRNALLNILSVTVNGSSSLNSTYLGTA